MNLPTKLKLLMDRVFASGCIIAHSRFKKISHTVEQDSGEQVVVIEYRFKVKGSGPISKRSKIRESSHSFPMLSSLSVTCEKSRRR